MSDLLETKDNETRKQLIRLVSISKIEEFAILTNSIIDPETKKELESTKELELRLEAELSVISA